VVLLGAAVGFQQDGRAALPVNLRLAAMRRLAFEAADTGLLSPELAAGIARANWAKRIGVAWETG